MTMFESLFGGRIKTVERRLKSLHFKQSKLRDKIAEATEKGDKEKVRSLQAEREAVGKEVAELTAEHKKLKSEA